MILFQITPPYTTFEPPPYHIVRKKGWRQNFVDNEIMSLVIYAYCRKEFVANDNNTRSTKLISITKDERKKYKEKICQECIKEIVSENKTTH